jgi:cobalt/nickel transport system permease protein
MPMLGLAAAFVFAAQMLNFPVAGGTSGHLLGGVLTAILLGPSAAIVVMTCVLLIQCLMFSDGGLLALGANVLNMAVVSVCGGYFIFRLVKKLARMDDQRSTVFAAAFAGWCGTVLASLMCAGQLALSGKAAWGVVFPAMANIHMLIGLGEGLATALILRAILRTRPALLAAVDDRQQAGRAAFLGYGLILALALALFVAPFACPWPDGLEHVAERLKIMPHGAAVGLPAPLRDYQLPGVGSATTATALAGGIGTVVAFLAAYLLACLLVPALAKPDSDARPKD